MEGERQKAHQHDNMCTQTEQQPPLNKPEATPERLEM